MIDTQFINAIMVSLIFGLIMGIAEMLYSKLDFQVEQTRKLVHIWSGLLCLSFPFLFESTFLVFGLCVSFLLLLLASKKYEFLNSVNAVKRKTAGSTWFPVVVFLCFAVFQHYGHLAFFYAPIITLTLADSMACLIGKKFPIKQYHFNSSTKSIGGTLTFFTISMTVAAFSLQQNFGNPFYACICFALATTIAELFGGKGHDNFTIPLAAISILALFFSPQFGIA